MNDSKEISFALQENKLNKRVGGISLFSKRVGQAQVIFLKSLSLEQYMDALVF